MQNMLKLAYALVIKYLRKLAWLLENDVCRILMLDLASCSRVFGKIA